MTQLRRMPSAKCIRAIVCLVVLALSVAARGETPGISVSSWQSLFAGVDRAEVTSTGNWLMHGHVLRIELQTPGLEFVTTPGNGDRPRETDGLRTSTFLAKQGLQAAINAAPFSPVQNAENQPLDVIGLHISAGLLVSKPHPKYPALLITRANQASISAPPLDLKTAYNAVGGFGTVLEQGTLTGSTEERHPRTAVGISADGRTMYWLAIDGRQPFYSEGATTRETGEILLKMGASEGINLDGGGTTTLVIADRGRPLVVNRPIHLGLPGIERVAGSHLGLRARPLSVVANPIEVP